MVFKAPGGKLCIMTPLGLIKGLVTDFVKGDTSEGNLQKSFLCSLAKTSGAFNIPVSVTLESECSIHFIAPKVYTEPPWVISTCTHTQMLCVIQLCATASSTHLIRSEPSLSRNRSIYGHVWFEKDDWFHSPNSISIGASGHLPARAEMDLQRIHTIEISPLVHLIPQLIYPRVCVFCQHIGVTHPEVIKSPILYTRVSSS